MYGLNCGIPLYSCAQANWRYHRNGVNNFQNAMEISSKQNKIFNYALDILIINDIKLCYSYFIKEGFKGECQKFY